MKKYLIIPLLITLGCTVTEERKQEIATITCNIIAESRNMDGVLRLTELNKARKEIGEDPFLGTDEDILFAFKHGLCRDLVLNDSMYDSLVLSKREEVRKEEEKERLELLQQIENNKKRLREERLEIERKRSDQIVRDQNRLNKVIDEYFKEFPLQPELLEISTSGTYKFPAILVTIRCSPSEGFYHSLVLKLKTHQEVSKEDLCTSNQDGISKQTFTFSFSNEVRSDTDDNTNHPILNEIESIRFILTGRINYSYLRNDLPFKFKYSLDPNRYDLPNDKNFFTVRYEYELLEK